MIIFLKKLSEIKLKRQQTVPQAQEVPVETESEYYLGYKLAG
jgi:hypothetical protein